MLSYFRKEKRRLIRFFLIKVLSILFLSCLVDEHPKISEFSVTNPALPLLNAVDSLEVSLFVENENLNVYSGQKNSEDFEGPYRLEIPNYKKQNIALRIVTFDTRGNIIKRFWFHYTHQGDKLVPIPSIQFAQNSLEAELKDEMIEIPWVKHFTSNKLDYSFYSSDSSLVNVDSEGKASLKGSGEVKIYGEIFDIENSKDSLTLTIKETLDPERLDYLPPTINLVSPVSSTVSTSPIELEFDVFDGSGVESFTINDLNTEMNNEDLFTLSLYLEEGLNEFRALAIDGSPNQNTKIQLFSLTYNGPDKSPPLITIISPPDSSVFFEESINIRINIIDKKSEVLNTSIYIGNAKATPIQELENEWGTIFTFSEPGPYHIPISAKDEKGNLAVDTLFLTYDPSLADTLAPVLHFSEASNTPFQIFSGNDSVILEVVDTVWNDTAIFQFSVEDDHPQVETVLRQYDPAKTLVISGTEIYPQFNNSAGTYTAQAEITKDATFFKLDVWDGRSDPKNQSEAHFAIFRGVPLDSITVDTLIFSSNDLENFNAKDPVIIWHPSNATLQTYSIELPEGATADLAIPFNRNQRLSPQQAGTDTLFIVPNEDTTKQKELIVIIEPLEISN